MNEQIENKEINKKENNKKQLILSVIGVLTLVVIAVGISFAIWNYTFNGSLTNSLSTADISLELLESDDNVIAIENALPMSDNEGIEQAQVFDFVVTSKTTRDIDIDYTVNIEKLSVDSGYTSLNDNQIKVYLTDEAGTQKLAPTLISNLSNYKLYKGKHSHDSTHNKVQSKYKLRVWIDQNVDASSWTSSTKLQYKFKIGVTSEEKVPENVVYSYTVGGTDAETGDVTGGINIGDTLASITGATQDYTTLNQTFFLKHVIGSNNTVVRNDVCFIKNNNLYCLKGVEIAYAGYDENNPAPYYGENYNTLLEAFGPNAIENNVCSGHENYIDCSASGLDASAHMGGNVNASAGSTACYANRNGTSACYE